MTGQLDDGGQNLLAFHFLYVCRSATDEDALTFTPYNVTYDYWKMDENWSQLAY